MEYIAFSSELVEGKAKQMLKKNSSAKGLFVKVGRKNLITPETAKLAKIHYSPSALSEH